MKKIKDKIIINYSSKTIPIKNYIFKFFNKKKLARYLKLEMMNTYIKFYIILQKKMSSESYILN